MRYSTRLVVLAALTLTLAGCVHWTRSEPVIAERRKLWQALRDAVAREYEIDDAKTEWDDGYLISKWRYDLAVNYLEGYRSRVEIELEPLEEDQDKPVADRRWTVKLRVFKEENENVDQPLLKEAAEWGRNVYWEDKELMLMQQIVISFANYGISDYALSEAHKPLAANAAATRTRPLARTRSEIWKSLVKVCNSYYEPKATHEKAGKYESGWQLRGTDPEVADIRTRLTVRILPDTTTDGQVPVYRIEVRIDQQSLGRDKQWSDDGRDTVGEAAITEKIEQDTLGG